jgi:hypothetical protein
MFSTWLERSEAARRFRCVYERCGPARSWRRAWSWLVPTPTRRAVGADAGRFEGAGEPSAQTSDAKISFPRRALARSSRGFLWTSLRHRRISRSRADRTSGGERRPRTQHTWTSDSFQCMDGAGPVARCACDSGPRTELRVCRLLNTREAALGATSAASTQPRPQHVSRTGRRQPGYVRKGGAAGRVSFETDRRLRRRGLCPTPTDQAKGGRMYRGGRDAVSKPATATWRGVARTENRTWSARARRINVELSHARKSAAGRIEARCSSKTAERCTRTSCRPAARGSPSNQRSNAHKDPQDVRNLIIRLPRDNGCTAHRSPAEPRRRGTPARALAGR